MSTFLFPSHRRPAVLALTLCQIAVLSACGGGSDDEAPLASVSSAACPIWSSTCTSAFQASSWRIQLSLRSYSESALTCPRAAAMASSACG